MSMSSTEQNSMTGTNKPCTTRYQIPSHLSEHIDFISPGVGLAVSPTRATKENDLRRRQDTSCTPTPGATNLTLENCWLSASPQCYNALYNIPKPGAPHPNNSFGIFEADVSPIQSDMDSFFKQVTPEIPVGTIPKQILLNGANLSTEIKDLTQIEATLDFQVAWPLVYPQNLTLLESNITEAQAQLLIDSNLNFSSPSAASPIISLVIENMLGSIDAVCFTNVRSSILVTNHWTSHIVRTPRLPLVVPLRHLRSYRSHGPQTSSKLPQQNQLVCVMSKLTEALSS